MVDAGFSRQRQLEDHATLVHYRWLFAVALGAVLIGLGFVLLQRGFAGNSAAAMPSATAPREQVSVELLETTKGLQATQQQAVDQLQVVQDQLVAQKSETRKLSEQLATMTGKLEALQQSVADMPAPATGSSPKSRR
jgi:uncharacterized coiled-coil protein SlyX